MEQVTPIHEGKGAASPSGGLPALSRQPMTSKASATAKAYMDSQGLLKENFRKSKEHDSYLQELELALTRADKNGDGVFDRSEVADIVEEVRFNAFVAESANAGVKRMAEGLNSSKVNDEVCARARVCVYARVRVCACARVRRNTRMG